MRPLTAISLIFGAAAVGLALAPAPEPTHRAALARLTVAEAGLIERLRNMAVPEPVADEMVVAALTQRDPTERRPVASEPASSAPVPIVDLASEPQSAPTESDAPYVVVAEALNVRASPSNGASVVGRLLQGQSVSVADQNGGWLLVTDGSGVEGWAYSRYLTPASPQ